MLRRVVIGMLATAVTALVVGVPTGVIETSFYNRMTPVLWWNYPVWAISSMLTGTLVATYVPVRGVSVSPSEGGKTFLGSLLSLFAVGCPICNKLVVMALGVSGALTWFALLQPLLAVASLGLLVYALWARRRAAMACRMPAQSVAPEASSTTVQPRGQ